ncbi:MAG: pyruvate kinase alpha/beta domain-containing protein, partial [Clostridia bacterium]
AHQAEEDAEKLSLYGGMTYDNKNFEITNAVCDAACTTARDLNATAIIAVTKSGSTARRVSKFRPKEAIIGATPDTKTFHQLSLSWGVQPVLALDKDNAVDLLVHAIDCAKQIDVVKNGDKVVIIYGVPLRTAGNTNTVRVQIVDKSIYQW